MKTDKQIRQDWQNLATCLQSELEYLASDLQALVDEGNRSIDKLCDDGFEGVRPKRFDFDGTCMDPWLYHEAKYVEHTWDAVYAKLVALRMDILRAANAFQNVRTWAEEREERAEEKAAELL